MPAFVENGPDIPDQLLQDHEAGKVVFFCGAGISVSAGLPLFDGLVREIYLRLGEVPSPLEASAIDASNFETALHLLEKRYPGKRFAVRHTLLELLKPNLKRKRSGEGHSSILQLATDREGKVRLVTTNYDRIFDKLIQKKRLNVPSYAAPQLPIPKRSRWNGIVYLHGMLPASPDEALLNTLVLTSGDFGLAYLTERWASRFVTELLRDYTVCFVGYRLNDIVMRYMMDALAADELHGERRRPAYVFASVESGVSVLDSETEWKAKGVQPILYGMPKGPSDHSLLGDSLREWANTHRDGVNGKRMIVAQHAHNPPPTCRRSDFVGGRMQWALSDASAAEYFSKLIPPPPLSWLECFCENDYLHGDLVRFQIAPNEAVDERLKFSLFFRPCPYTRSEWMQIVQKFTTQNWDEVMSHMAYWLLRHLNNPKLVLWVSSHGGVLAAPFHAIVSSRIADLANIADDKIKREQIALTSPDAIPSTRMRNFWRLALEGRLKLHSHSHQPFLWAKLFQSVEFDSLARTELRKLLALSVELRPRGSWERIFADGLESSDPADEVESEIVLSFPDMRSALKLVETQPKWKKVSVECLRMFIELLREALELSADLGRCTEKSDLSYIYMPAIDSGSQYPGRRDWTLLVDLVRDAWAELNLIDGSSAVNVGVDIWHLKFPLFRRLALFAATRNEVLKGYAARWLQEENGWWLWSTETERETLRYLVLAWPTLPGASRQELEDAIIAGPPGALFREDAEAKLLEPIVSRDMWLRLSKVALTGVTLGSAAQARLHELASKYPEWRIASDGSDEFPFKLTIGKNSQGATTLALIGMPASPEALAEWLKDRLQKHVSDWSAVWEEYCRDKLSISSQALSLLSEQGDWLIGEWRVVFQRSASSPQDRLAREVLERAALRMPSKELSALVHSVSWWLAESVKAGSNDPSKMVSIADKLISTKFPESATSDSLQEAINHPIGIVTQTLVNSVLRQENSTGSSEVWKLLTRLTDIQEVESRAGRTILASHLVQLYRTNEAWTHKRLLPLFDWTASVVEAQAAWKGFLWAPTLYLPVVSANKRPILETAKHYEKLDDMGTQYAEFLTFIALDPKGIFQKTELSKAVRGLPTPGLEAVVSALVRALNGAGEQRSEYWNNRIVPFLHDMWPKDTSLLTSVTAEQFAELCIVSDDSFPEAIARLRNYIVGVEHPEWLAARVADTNLCELFPETVLEFLTVIYTSDRLRTSWSLERCLELIGKADTTLVNTEKFKKLLRRCR